MNETEFNLYSNCGMCSIIVFHRKKKTYFHTVLLKIFRNVFHIVLQERSLALLKS